MNSLMERYYPVFQLYQALRGQMMEMLTDDDLSFHPGGENLTLGALCRQIGEVQYAYIESFKTFQIDFSYRNEEPGIDTSVRKLSSWFDEQDKILKEILESFSEEELQKKTINRGGDFILPIQIQLDVYKEALLIFYGKSNVYLKMMGKTLPEQWRHWID